jgi:hypothetical protein
MVIKKKGNDYFNFEEAIIFIKQCKKKEYAIIGIEGFIKENNEFIPQLDIIADFSEYNEHNWISYVNSCAGFAKKFIDHFSNNKKILFQFVVISKDR